MRLVTLSLIICCFMLFPAQVLAVTDPLAVPNNKFGIHIIDPNDLEDAAQLVNSSGGKWGYVTLVVREDERDVPRWNKIFNSMSDLHLIPIVRIASISKNGQWEKLQYSDIPNWINFLDQLNWPTVNRYIVVGNEPNHATEWGGEINPEEYAEYLKEFYSLAKIRTGDFYILNAGFDASAPDGVGYMSEETYLHLMYQSDPDVFDYLDGWASHSYPNPGFSGSSDDWGKGSVRTYIWELELLDIYDVVGLPIFVTETGWAHDIDGTVLGQSDYGQDRYAFKSIDEVSVEYKNA
ncbi:hypothetical protein ACFL2C_02685, partial [Patescibacteria group bacterium]